MPDQHDRTTAEPTDQQVEQQARPRRRGRAWLVAAAVVLLAVGVTGGFVWGHHRGSDSADTVGAVASRAQATGHDATDVRFAQMMLPHHQQAIDMVEMVDSRTDSEEVRTLATQIAAAQQPEIDTMTGWLDQWHATPDTGQLDGMMTEADMDRLGRLSGGGFDREWLTMMIQHHESAVDMARAEIAGGENADALALATSIQVTQVAQVAQMREMLR